MVLCVENVCLYNYMYVLFIIKHTHNITTNPKRLLKRIDLKTFWREFTSHWYNKDEGIQAQKTGYFIMQNIIRA